MLIFNYIMVSTLTFFNFLKLEISLGELLTIFVAVIGLIFAICQYRSAKKQTWFLNVIVLPQLELIKNFYLGLIERVKDDQNMILELEDEKHNLFTTEIAKLKNKRIKEINDFFDHLSALVSSYDENLARKVTSIAMDLQDTYVKIIDELCNKIEVKAREKILNSENRLISELTKEMAK